MSLIPALERQRQRQEDVFELEASLVYITSSRTPRAPPRNPVLKNQPNKQKVSTHSPKLKNNKSFKRLRNRRKKGREKIIKLYKELVSGLRSPLKTSTKDAQSSGRARN